MKSYTQHNNKCITGRNIHKQSIQHTYTENNTTTMNLNQLLLLIQDLYMGVLLQLSAILLCSRLFLLLLLNCYNDTNEGVYIRFSLFLLELSNLRIQFYLPATTTINASVYLRRERMARGLSTFLTKALKLNDLI
jgi:hypothetical protein